MHALDRLRLLGVKSLAERSLEWLLDDIIQLPFTDVPWDLYVLVTATKLGEKPEEFYERLLATPVMRPVVQRFLDWLSSHDPATCEAHDHDLMVPYCSPRYYVALCETIADLEEDWASGEFAGELAGELRRIPNI